MASSSESQTYSFSYVIFLLVFFAGGMWVFVRGVSADNPTWMLLGGVTWGLVVCVVGGDVVKSRKGIGPSGAVPTAEGGSDA